MFEDKIDTVATYRRGQNAALTQDFGPTRARGALQRALDMQRTNPQKSGRSVVDVGSRGHSRPMKSRGKRDRPWNVRSEW